MLWGGTDDGSHPQLTLLLTNEGGDDGGPLSGFAYSDFYEKGDAPYSAIDRAPLAPPPPSGQGEYLVSLDAVGDPVPANPVGGYFFFIDDSCTPPLNGYPNEPGVPLVYTVGGVSPDDFSEFATISNVRLAAAAARAVTLSAKAKSDPPGDLWPDVRARPALASPTNHLSLDRRSLAIHRLGDRHRSRPSWWARHPSRLRRPSRHRRPLRQRRD